MGWGRGNGPGHSPGLSFSLRGGGSLRWCLISILSDTGCAPAPPPVPHPPVPAPPAGQLSLDEFIDGARKDKWVMKMLQMDVNPGGWITEQRRKSALF